MSYLCIFTVYQFLLEVGTQHFMNGSLVFDCGSQIMSIKNKASAYWGQDAVPSTLEGKSLSVPIIHEV